MILRSRLKERRAARHVNQQEMGRLCGVSRQKISYRAVESLTREAFWNQYVPGCEEHYLVHTMRNHADFIPELAFVLDLNGEIIGNIMYTRGKRIDKDGNEESCLSFGPVSIAPEHQRLYGKCRMN